MGGDVFYKVIGNQGRNKDIDLSGCMQLRKHDALRFKRRVERMGFEQVRIVERHPVG